MAGPGLFFQTVLRPTRYAKTSLCSSSVEKVKTVLKETQFVFVKMGGGNGAKAAQKRERNADKNKKAPGSQLKQNEAAKTIVCVLCKQSFLGTMRKPALSTHAEVIISPTAQGC